MNAPIQAEICNIAWKWNTKYIGRCRTFHYIIGVSTSRCIRFVSCRGIICYNVSSLCDMTGRVVWARILGYRDSLLQSAADIMAPGNAGDSAGFYGKLGGKNIPLLIDRNEGKGGEHAIFQCPPSTWHSQLETAEIQGILKWLRQVWRCWCLGGWAWSRSPGSSFIKWIFGRRRILEQI